MMSLTYSRRHGNSGNFRYARLYRTALGEMVIRRQGIHSKVTPRDFVPSCHRAIAPSRHRLPLTKHRKTPNSLFLSMAWQRN